ncbi:hypothetical protein QTO34_007661 [Cnephaeus nilssonii]|uniref:Atg6/beclin coiled-coil domain-containing protein n=1 Tax=Cnephaeus nilssonii TaxID=3371016 RepID=A0AA40HIS0_CNENI|nr:hypothetical protein QTO34_007661 [Eptesicus nilssonii]
MAVLRHRRGLWGSEPTSPPRRPCGGSEWACGAQSSAFAWQGRNQKNGSFQFLMLTALWVPGSPTCSPQSQPISPSRRLEAPCQQSRRDQGGAAVTFLHLAAGTSFPPAPVFLWPPADRSASRQRDRPPRVPSAPVFLWPPADQSAAGGQRKTGAGGKLVPAAMQSATLSSATGAFCRPHGSSCSAGRWGRQEERGGGGGGRGLGMPVDTHWEASPGNDVGKTEKFGMDVALEGVGHFFLELVEKKLEGAEHLKDTKPAQWPHSLQDMLKPPRMSKPLPGRGGETHQEDGPHLTHLHGCRPPGWLTQSTEALGLDLSQEPAALKLPSAQQELGDTPEEGSASRMETDIEELQDSASGWTIPVDGEMSGDGPSNFTLLEKLASTRTLRGPRGAFVTSYRMKKSWTTPCARTVLTVSKQLDTQLRISESDSQNYKCCLEETRDGLGEDARETLQEVELEEARLVQEPEEVEKNRERAAVALEAARAETEMLEQQERQYHRDLSELQWQQLELRAMERGGRLRYAQTQSLAEETNAFKAMFEICCDGPLAVINSFRLGCIPAVPVSWGMYHQSGPPRHRFWPSVVQVWPDSHSSQHCVSQNHRKAGRVENLQLEKKREGTLSLRSCGGAEICECGKGGLLNTQQACSQRTEREGSRRCVASFLIWEKNKTSRLH